MGSDLLVWLYAWVPTLALLPPPPLAMVMDFLLLLSHLRQVTFF